MSSTCADFGVQKSRSLFAIGVGDQYGSPVAYAGVALRLERKCRVAKECVCERFGMVERFVE